MKVIGEDQGFFLLGGRQLFQKGDRPSLMCAAGSPQTEGRSCARCVTRRRKTGVGLLSCRAGFTGPSGSGPGCTLTFAKIDPTADISNFHFAMTAKYQV